MIAWQPPQSLLLAWQINADSHYDADLVTEVEVKFIAESAGVTRIELEHRYLERVGSKADAARNAVDSPGGSGRHSGFVQKLRGNSTLMDESWFT